MKKLKIKKVFITKQGEHSQNFQEFFKIAKEKNISIYQVKAGDKIIIEENCCFKVLFPTDELIQQNVLNNNSMVAKFTYYNFTALFTGDIEEIAEKQIIEMYKNTNELKVNLLKVAHHGSKTSSTQEILNVIKPQIAFIGVGKDNKFGHPNKDVIERFQNLRCKSL